jgi:hypothetical protein
VVLADAAGSNDLMKSIESEAESHAAHSTLFKRQSVSAHEDGEGAAALKCSESVFGVS